MRGNTALFHAVQSAFPLRLVFLIIPSLFAPTGVLAADSGVAIVASANPEYTHRKFNGAALLPESYVVMQGKYFEGATVDKSIDRMPFKRVIDYFVPELARREYWPAKSAQAADLVIVVHWGTTVPRASTREMMARNSSATDTNVAQGAQEMRNLRTESTLSAGESGDILGTMVAEQMAQNDMMPAMDIHEVISEQFARESANANLAQVLGYSNALRKFTGAVSTTEQERTLRHDLTQERYFIILKAYNLKKLARGGGAAAKRPEWTLHINMQSPGINFGTALDRMSAAAVNFVGRTTDSVETVRPGERQAKVLVGEPIIVREK